MFIKIKTNEGKFIKVDVRDKNCKNKSCFGYHKYNHYNKSIDGKSSSWRDNFYSCPNRNYHGCF